MPKSRNRSLRAAFHASLAGLFVMATPNAATAETSKPAVMAVPGKPNLLIGTYDLGELGYQVEEHFFSGTATSYRLPGPPTSDGVWNAEPSATAPFNTRVVVVRPSDPKKFNGTVLVEWFNVTAGQDTPADWMVAHREMLRSGYAYVGVSAQKVGVEGGEAIMQQGVPLKKADAQRYGALSHPGDAWSYDIFSQAGRLLKVPGASGLLGPLTPRRIIAIGESQSAAFLVTYVNAVDRLAKVYDGFFIHSRFGSGAAIDGTRVAGAPSSVPNDLRFRTDLRVPLLTLITETDLLGARLPGYHAARQPDTARLRVWEVAGTSHADNYLFAGAFIDSGKRPVADLAKVFVPSTNSMMGKLAIPLNPGMPHHYVVEAAISALDNWVRRGKAPATTARLALANSAAGGAPALERDSNGLARGGIRTPWVDVPTIVLSGKGDPNSFIGMLGGGGTPLTRTQLANLYPGGKSDYLGKFTVALDTAIAAGHVLKADRQEILEIAAINYDAVP